MTRDHDRYLDAWNDRSGKTIATAADWDAGRFPGLLWPAVRSILVEAVTAHGYTRFARSSKKSERERVAVSATTSLNVAPPPPSSSPSSSATTASLLPSIGAAMAAMALDALPPRRASSWNTRDDIEAAALFAVVDATCCISFRQFCVVVEAPELYSDLISAATTAVGAGIVKCTAKFPSLFFSKIYIFTYLQPLSPSPPLPPAKSLIGRVVSCFCGVE